MAKGFGECSTTIMTVKKKSLLWQIPLLLLLIVGSVVIVRQHNNQPYQRDEGFIFGTVYHAIYQYDHSINDEILAELKKVDASLSMFNDSSTISLVNKGQNPDVKGSMFEEVFRLAQSVSEDTGGAFDVTVAPLVDAWGFGTKKGITPTAKAVDSLRQVVGWKKVRAANERGGVYIHKADPRVRLDCSAIAKGYGSDMVARLMRRKGIDNFMIEIGGEMVVHGHNPEKQDWKIGVNKPTADTLGVNHELEAVLQLTDKALATSGNYRNFYYRGGRKYAHTIDPKTGWPVQHNILSATVVAPNCATADAYATAFMVLGLDKSRAILDRHPELAACLVYSDRHGHDAIWYSSTLKNKITR